MRSRVDGLIERTLAIQQDAHQSVLLPIGVFDRAFAFSKLSVIALLARSEVRRVPLTTIPAQYAILPVGEPLGPLQGDPRNFVTQKLG